MQFHFISDHNAQGGTQRAELAESAIMSTLSHRVGHLSRAGVQVVDGNGATGGPDDVGCIIQPWPEGMPPTMIRHAAAEAKLRGGVRKTRALRDRAFGNVSRP